MPDSPPLNLAVRHSRLNRVRLGTAWAAWFVILNGFASLVARFIGPARVPALTLGLMPMHPVLAVAHIGNGLALWAFIVRRRGMHLASSVVSLLLGLFVFVFVARSPDSTDLPTSVAGSLLCVFASFALVIAWIRGRSGLVNLTFGVAGFVLLSLSITVIGVRVIGAFGPDTARIFVGASSQGLINSIVLSLCFLGLVWAEGFSTTRPPVWVAPAAGIACLFAVLLLWRALDARETEQLQSQMLLVGRVQREAIYRDARAMAGSLRRAAEWAARGVSAEQQTSDLAALVRDLPGLVAGLRVSQAGYMLLRMPLDFDASSVTEAWRRQVLRSERLDTLSYIQLDSRAERFAVVSPICTGGTCNGAVVAVVDAGILFASTLPSADGGFLLAVHQNGRVLGTDSLRLPSSFWREDLDLRLGTVRWQLAVMPTAATLRQMRTTLPSAVLFMGLIVSALLPVTLRLGQVAWRTAHASERARLSSALERATDAIWERDLVTGHDERTRGLWRHLGYDPATFAPEASAWSSLIHPDDRADVDAALARHISGAAATFETEYRVRDRSGNWHVIVDRGRLVERQADGSPARLVGICADVTEARRMQEARDTSERRFRAIFDSGFQCKLLLEADGRVLEVNRASLDLAAVPADVVLDRPVWETLWWRSNAESAERLRGEVASASGGETVRYEEELSDIGGSTLILEVGLKQVNPGEGRASQLLLEARDITARRRVDAALQELETLAAMGRIAARVAHEINNPLAGIQYSFLLIKDAIPRDHPHYRYVGAIEREITRIAAVTRQLYETYRPEKETSASASLSTIIGDAVSFLEQVNRASAVRIQTDLSRAPSIVPVPSAVLRQIVYNLVQNAMDASPPNEAVFVSAVATVDTLEIRVSDNGPGLPAELRQRVFEPFFSTKDMRMRTSGMGLGLALVQQTVKSAGGSIRVEQAPTGGALFVVTLPLSSAKKTEVA
jgi:PAS domain S-box-containing protein